MTPVGCAVGPTITGQWTLEGIPVLGLVDTGASVTCLGFSVWWRYRAQWGSLRQFEGTAHDAHGKPLQIAGKTQHLNLQWGEARGRACFIVIVGLESPPCLIGMDIMRPLLVHIDVTHGTATPAQPDPPTVHLNAAQSRQQPPEKHGLATLETAFPPQNPQQRKEMPLQGAEIPATKTDHAPPPQSQPQRKKMPLLGTDFAAVDTAHPPQTQSQRMEMPLLDVDSPDMGAAFPPEFSQQRMKMPLTEIDPSAMGAAYSSHSQPQRRKMPLPETQTLAPPIAESSLQSASATALPGEPTSNAPLPTVLPCAAMPHTASLALLLQTTAIPPEMARLVRCHNLWPTEDFLFCPGDALPAFVTGIPVLSSGPELWIAIYNYWPEPLQLHSGQNIGVLKVVTMADTPPAASQPGPPCRSSLPERLLLLQQQQLNALFQEFSDIFSQGEDDLGSTPLLEHTIETHGPPLRQPYRRQNPAVRWEEMAQVQQMLASNVIRPSNSPWSSPVVMVRKMDGSLRFCFDFRRSPITQDRRPPRRSPWGSMVLHPRPQERVLAGAHHRE